jgi:hypothetical protein
MRAIIDTGLSGEGDRDILRQALAAGLRAGLVTRREINRAKAIPGLPEWLGKMLDAAAP